MRNSFVSSSLPDGPGATNAAPGPVEELAAYFATAELPADGYMLDSVTRLDNVKLFISSHLAMIRGRTRLRGYRPYFERLVEFKTQLEMKKKTRRPQAKPQGKDFTKGENEGAILSECEKAKLWKKPAAQVEKLTGGGDKLE